MRNARKDADPAERRREERMPTTLRGKAFPGAVDCIVSDMSEHGACLTFEGEAVSDDRLLLVIWSTGIAFEADVRWRQGQRVGVLFCARRDFRAQTPARFHEARALWRQSRPKLKLVRRTLRSGVIGAPS